MNPCPRWTGSLLPVNKSSSPASDSFAIHDYDASLKVDLYWFNSYDFVMNRLDTYIELGKSKGLKRSQIDPPIARLIRIFYRELPPLITLPTQPHYRSFLAFPGEPCFIQDCFCWRKSAREQLCLSIGSCTWWSCWRAHFCLVFRQHF